MNLCEGLVGLSVFLIASCGSLQLLAGLGRSVVAQNLDEAASQRLERQLVRSDQSLRQWAMELQGTTLASCRLSGRLLLARLQQVPLEPALERQLAEVAPGVVRQALRAEGGRWGREQWFSGSAYGLCRPESAVVGSSGGTP